MADRTKCVECGGMGCLKCRYPEASCDPSAGDDRTVYAISCVKIVQAVRPGDVVFIETDREWTAEQMKRIDAVFKSKLPDIRVVVLNKGSRVVGKPEEKA